MAATCDEAVAELFRAPHATFVAERKRLAGELEAALARLKQQVTEAEGRVLKARARVAELDPR